MLFFYKYVLLLPLQSYFFLEERCKVGRRRKRKGQQVIQLCQCGGSTYEEILSPSLYIFIVAFIVFKHYYHYLSKRRLLI